MKDFIFSLNATMPVFLLMALGFIFNKIGAIDENFANKLNNFVFKISLPILLFRDLSVSNFIEVWDGKFVLFCFLATFFSIIIMMISSKLLKDKDIRGEFIQGGFRSSAALLGSVYIQNIYGKSGAVSLMIIGAVPLYNITSVIILMLMKPGNNQKLDKTRIVKTLKGIMKNPIILGILVGILWSLFRIPQPFIMKKTIASMAGLASPLGLLALGASFNIKEVFLQIKPTLAASTFKLAIFVAIFLPVAIILGFRADKLIAALVMLGGASTVTSYTMAKSEGHHGAVSAGVVMFTTIMSVFTLTGWIYLLKIFNLI